MAVQQAQNGQTIRARHCVHCGHLNAGGFLACQSCRQSLSGSEWIDMPTQTAIHEIPQLSIHDMPTTVLPNGKKALQSKILEDQTPSVVTQDTEETPRRSVSGFFQKRSTGALARLARAQKAQSANIPENTPIPGVMMANGATQGIASSTLETHVVRPVRKQIKSGTSVFAPGMVVCIEIEGKNTPIVLRPSQGQSLNVGRDEAKSKERPEIDLVPYGAFQQGISRRHASLELIGKCLMIRDLGSSNGTFLNENRLDAHEAHQLRDGDTLRLGHMKMRIAFKA